MITLTKSWQRSEPVQEIGTNRLVDALHESHTRYRSSRPLDKNLFSQIRTIVDELQERMILARIEFRPPRALTEKESEQRDCEREATIARGRSFLGYFSRLVNQHIREEKLDIAQQYIATHRLYSRIIGRYLLEGNHKP
jgi:hypothetical protein